MMNKKTITNIFLSGKQIDWISIIVLGPYAFQGYYNFSTSGFPNLNVLCIFFSGFCSLFFGLVYYIPSRYINADTCKERFIPYAELVLRYVLLAVIVTVYLINSHYVSQNILFYLVPCYILTI